MTQPRFRGAALLLLLAMALSVRALGQPAHSSPHIRPTRPGSKAAARYDGRLRFVAPRMGGVFTRAKSGLLVPDRRLVLTSAKSRTNRARWAQTRGAVFRHLKRSGARPSPAPYQKLVKKIRSRAERVMRSEGNSLGSWKMVVLEGGKADQVNAAAWSGGVITIYRPLVDLCYQIANVATNTSSPVQLDGELWKLSRWRRNKNKGRVPQSARVPRGQVAKRDRIAESILSRVVLHEMGHAASGHVQLRDRELFIPGKKTRDLARSRDMEREADLFASVLGSKGAVAVPGAMPLFSYYNFISRPTLSERGKYDVADWRTHPIDAERYNNQYKVLKATKRTAGLPKPLGRRIILPGGGYATPSKPASVTPIRPRPRPAQQPQQQAAARPRLPGF